MADVAHPGSELPLVVERDGVHLAGTLWMPGVAPRAVVLMHPGSGPSDRSNGGDFAPIRSHLLAAGIAVAAFDKRGVGGSTGDWLTAGIGDQAADASACLDAVAAQVPGVPLGAFGHSQGGWVVLEVGAMRDDLAFLVTSSGPGVSPAAQERHATAALLGESSLAPQEMSEALRCFDLALVCMSLGLDHGAAVEVIRAAGLGAVHARAELFSYPLDDPDLWRIASRIVDHDPQPAMRRLEVPVLAMFGGRDRAVPVDASAVAHRSCVRADLLTLTVLDGADHRLHRGGRLHEDHLPTLDRFIDRALG